MIKSRKFFVVLVMAALGLTTGASVVEADPPANAPYSLETIATITGGDVGKHVSIAFNENTGKPYISYYDETNGDLRLIYPHSTVGNCGPNNEWYCETLDTEGDVGQYSSIDYFIDGATGYVKIGIAYHDATYDVLKVAIWSRIGFSYRWDVYIVDGGGGLIDVGYDASLKFDSNGSVHIAYSISSIVNGQTIQAVSHATPVTSGGNCGEGAAAGKWQCDVAVLGLYPSLDLTSADSPVIAMNELSGYLALCGKVGGTWSCVTVDEDAGWATSFSLAIDQLGLPHIGYYDYSNGYLKYATYVGTGGNCGFSFNSGAYEYQCDIIDTIGDSQILVGLSVDVDPDGYPVIAYQNDSDPSGFSVLNVARPALAHGTSVGNCGPIVNSFRRWQCETIDDATQGGGAGNLYEADFASVAVDPNGFAAIAYNEMDDYHNEGRLKFASQENSNSIFSDDFESASLSAWSSSAGGP